MIFSYSYLLRLTISTGGWLRLGLVRIRGLLVPSNHLISENCSQQSLNLE